MARYLVVANQTAESPELLGAVLEINRGDPDAEFVIVVPATPLNLLEQLQGDVKSGGALAARRVRSTRRHLEDHGLRLRSTRVGNRDPYVAIEQELASDRFEAIVISTLPPGVSRWLRTDLTSRVARRYPDLRLIHVVTPSATDTSVATSTP